MSTSHTTFRRRARRGALALMVSAILVPASSALAQGDRWYDPPVTPVPATGDNLPGKGDRWYDPPVTPVPATGGNLPGKGDNPADFPGMPGSPPAPTPVATHALEADGFEWTSAAIGAAGAGLLIVVALGGATAASRLRFRTMRS
jgi:hypothetical protein